MKVLVAALGVALYASVAGNIYQAVPAGKPSKPAYVQRVEQLLVASNAGQWAKACDVAPTAAYSYGDFVNMAIGYGATTYKQLAVLCEKVFQVGLTKADGKTPLGLTWKVVYWEKPDGKASPAREQLVIVKLRWNGPGQTERTVVFHVGLERIAWVGPKAKCKGKPCPALRYYVLGAT